MNTKTQNVICPPCGENVGLPTKRGLLNKEYFINNPPSVLRTTSPTGGEVNHSFTQTVVYKNCHSRGMLSGIHTLAKEQGEDPRQKPSGMTLNKITVRGFTLIELLVVVLIIGILAAVALPQYQKAVIKSRYATVKPLVKSIADAQEAYYLATGTYPNKLSDLDIEAPAGRDSSSTDTKWKYTWGNIEIDGYGTSIGSINSVRYFIVNVHADIKYGNKNIAGKKICWFTHSNQEKAEPLCQNETNKTTPDHISASWSAYFYN